MNNKNAALLIASAIALSANSEIPQVATINIRKKKCTKRIKSEKHIKAGRNHPAKGYDPITKTWIKETK